MSFIQRVKNKIESLNFIQSKESWTFYRFFVFFFSMRGQKRIIKFAFKVLRFIWRRISGGKNQAEIMYDKWKSKNLPNEEKLKEYEVQLLLFEHLPLISIVIPIDKVDIENFKASIQSIDKQVYKNWEICISGNQFIVQELNDFIEELKERPKINYIQSKIDGQITTRLNSALSLTKGDFIAQLYPGDVLTEDALFQVVKKINENNTIDFIYSDEDKINEKGDFVEHHFKPDWSPDNLLSRNYIGHLTVIKKEIINQIGGFHEDFEGNHDFDLLLRATEKCKNITHIHKVLYHKRIHPKSTIESQIQKVKPIINGKKAVEEAHKRRGNIAKVFIEDEKEGIYRTEYKVESSPKISIIIPTKNNSEVVSTCLKSIFELTNYSNYEVILIDNNSDEPALFELINYWKKNEKDRFRTLELAFPFNFSRLMNEGVKFSNGDYILLLNNDTEVIDEEWLISMLRHAQRKEIGAVGVKLLYPNDRIQHAGVVIGLGAAAGHILATKPKSDTGYHNNLTAVNNYTAVTAACLMVSKENFNKVNGFDEELAVDYNDVDFCLKLHTAGLLNLWIPEVTLYHYESLSRGHPHATKESYQRSRREIKYFKHRWQAYIDYDPYYNSNFTKITADFSLLV